MVYNSLRQLSMLEHGLELKQSNDASKFMSNEFNVKSHSNSPNGQPMSISQVKIIRNK